jgi:hypothetical protein
VELRGRESWPIILSKCSTSTEHLGFFYMAQIYDMGPTALLPLLRIFSALKNPTATAGFEPANFGTKGQHATPRPPKPLSNRWYVLDQHKKIHVSANRGHRKVCPI